MIVKVPPKDLHIIWNEVEPEIKKALDDCYTAQDILDGLIQKRFQLFISWEDKVESAVITEIAQYPRKRILRYFLAGGKNLDNWLEPIQKEIEHSVSSGNFIGMAKFSKNIRKKLFCEIDELIKKNVDG